MMTSEMKKTLKLFTEYLNNEYPRLEGGERKLNEIGCEMCGKDFTFTLYSYIGYDEEIIVDEFVDISIDDLIENLEDYADRQRRGPFNGNEFYICKDATGIYAEHRVKVLKNFRVKEP